MSYPEHPETIILKNAFYPKGLREIDVWNFYQKMKPVILRETMNRDVMFFIMVDVNKPIVRRRGSSGYIRLTPKNYDTIITGRTISIHSAMDRAEQFGIIDIDIDPRDGFKWAKKVTADVYDFVMEKMPVVKTATIRFTGKTSFHIVCDFGRKMNIDSIKFLLEKFLRESELSRVYTVGGKRTMGVPNLDLGSNCVKCNYITLGSLSVLGLQCLEIEYSKLMRFDPRRARI